MFRLHVYHPKCHMACLLVAHRVTGSSGISDRADMWVQVRLLVIDSVTFHFRQDSSDMAQRARVLASLAQSLTRLAAYRCIAIVLMNQVTTKVADGDISQIIPALGEDMSR